MKIGILTTSFPRWRHDFVGAFIYEAAHAIQQKGNQVKVIAMHSPGTPRHEIWDGIEIYRTRYLPEAWELLKSEGGGLPEVWKRRPMARIQMIPFMIFYIIDVLIHTRDCELLHANWTLSGIVAWMNYLLRKTPYLITVHGSDIYRTIKAPIVVGLTRISLSKAKKVIVVSQALRQVVNSIGVPASNIEVVPDGVNTEDFNPLPYEERENIVLFVGSLIERKGLQYLIRAFAKIIPQLPERRLILIGEGSQRIECERLAQSLGIAEKVKFTGGQPQDIVAGYMRKAKIFVLPSIEEGLGVVLLEALASGTPIVASRVGGIADVVDDNIGILVPPADPDGLAEAIKSMLLLQPKEWSELHDNARKKALEFYDWNHIAQRIIELY